MIKRRVAFEAGTVVYFQQEHLLIVLNQEVKSQDFKAHVVEDIVGLANAILVSKERLGAYEGFCCYILNL